MQTCRACLVKEENILEFDENYQNKYHLLTNIIIDNDNKLPKHMCCRCRDTIDNFIEYRAMCISSEAQLQKLKREYIEPPPAYESEDSKTIPDLIIKQEEYDDDITDTFCFEDEVAEKNIKNEESSPNFEPVQPPSPHTSPPADLAPQSCCPEPDVPTALDQFLTEQKSILIECTAKKKRNVNKLVSNKQNSELLLSSKNDMLPCGLCRKQLTSKEELIQHLDKHKINYVCSLCDETFKLWPQLISHRINHISIKQRHCHLCWRKFRKDFYLEYHYYMHHYEKEFPGIVCKQCPKIFKNPSKLRKHKWSAHATSIYKCDHCPLKFSRKPNLIIHIQKHDKKRNHICTICNAAYKYRTGLQGHMIAKHAKTKHYCDKCTRYFAKETTLKTHKCSPTVVCPICGVCMKNCRSLSRHIKIHSDSRPHKCDRCPATYKSRRNLLEHINKHDGNKTEQCEFCQTKFYSRSVLIKHRRIHTGEKPYVCTLCDKAFTGNNNLKVHMKTHGEMLIRKKEKELP